jgi:GH24 family phage-related lysozyme (muramidase)
MGITKISENGLTLIKKFEGCRLTAYQDSVGVWTIGYGTTNADKTLTGLTIKKGVTITQAQADKFLEDAINKKYAAKVSKYNEKYAFNQNQFDALVSFAYNIGSIDQLTAYGTRTISEISTKILAYNKAGGKELAGLTNRRKAEKELFDKKVASTSVTFKKKYTVKAQSGLNMRKSPVNGSIVATIPNGKQVTYAGKYEKKNGEYWLYVTYGGKSGYCCKTYLS